MSVHIGAVNSPDHNSAHEGARVLCSRAGVEVSIYESDADAGENERRGVMRSFDPIAARNFAALLVRASEEVELMRKRLLTEEEV